MPDFDAPSPPPPSILDRLKGYRTWLAAAISSKLVPMIVLHLRQFGIELTAEQQVELAATIMAVLMAVMRAITDTAIGGTATRAVVLTSENVLKHIDLQLIARLVIAETIRLRTKPTPDKETTNG